MFGFSGEHITILAVVLLFFGPRALPEMGSVLGKSIRKFKETFSGIHEPEFKRLDPKESNLNVK